MHPSGPFLTLSDKEYDRACRRYPSLTGESDIKYEANSASGTINVGGENYFDNEHILEQFERLFQLLQVRKVN